jgi:hypothetical protein
VIDDEAHGAERLRELWTKRLTNRHRPAVLAAIAGLYPLANPSPAAARALQDPQLAALRCDFAVDLEAMITAILTSLVGPHARA